MAEMIMRRDVSGLLVVRVEPPADSYRTVRYFYTGRCYGPTVRHDLRFLQSHMVNAPCEAYGAEVVYWTHRLGSLNVDYVLDLASEMLETYGWYRPWSDEIRVYWLPDKWRSV